MKKTLIIALASLTLAACQLRFDKPTGDYFDAASIAVEAEAGGHTLAMISTVGDTQRAVFYNPASGLNSYRNVCETKNSYYHSNGNFYMPEVNDSNFTFTPLDDSTFRIKIANAPSALLNLKMCNVRRTADTIDYDIHLYGGLYSRNRLMLIGGHESDPLSDPLVRHFIVLNIFNRNLDEAAEDSILRAVDTIQWVTAEDVAEYDNCDKSFKELETKASALGYCRFEIHHKEGHEGCIFRCTDAPAGQKRCYDRTEKMSHVAGDMNMVFSVQHRGKNHSQCVFSCSKGAID